MPTVDDTRFKVQRMLQSIFGEVTIDGDGDFMFRGDSTMTFGEVLPWGDDDVIFNVWAPVLRKVPITNELCRFVATEPFVFGNLVLHEEPDGRSGDLQFQYRILANDIDDSELRMAVLMVAMTADDLDDKLVKRFGGELSFTD